MKKEINEADVFVGEYITNIRIKNRYAQADVSDLLNIPRSTFCCYERGTRSIPWTVMKKLCKLYHLDSYETFKYLDQELEKRGLSL